MKDFFHFLKGHKAIAITLVAIVVLVLYVAYKKNNAGGKPQTTTADNSALPVGQGSYQMGEPQAETIIISGGGGFNPAVSGTTGTAPGPISNIPPGGSTIPSQGPQPDHSMADDATFGLLGPINNWNPANRTYQNAQGQWVPIPVNPSDPLIQGGQGRVWYDEGGKQYLLTSGQGPAVTNSGYPIGSPQNTPGSYTSVNSKTQTAVNK